MSRVFASSLTVLLAFFASELIANSTAARSTGGLSQTVAESFQRTSVYVHPDVDLAPEDVRDAQAWVAGSKPAVRIAILPPDAVDEGQAGSFVRSLTSAGPGVYGVLSGQLFAAAATPGLMRQDQLDAIVADAAGDYDDGIGAVFTTFVSRTKEAVAEAAADRTGEAGRSRSDSAAGGERPLLLPAWRETFATETPLRPAGPLGGTDETEPARDNTGLVVLALAALTSALGGLIVLRRLRAQRTATVERPAARPGAPIQDPAREASKAQTPSPQPTPMPEERSRVDNSRLRRLVRRFWRRPRSGASTWYAFRHFPRILPFVRPQWKLVAVAFALIFASVVVGLAVPWPLAIVIDTVLGDKPLPDVLSPILGGLGTYELLTVLVISGLMLTALAYGLGIVDRYVTTKLHLALILDFRLALYEHAQRLSLGFYDRVPTGQIMFRLGPQSTSIGQIAIALPPLLQSFITIIGMFVIAVFIDWQLALLSLVVLPILVYATRFYARRVEPRVYDVRNLEAASQSILLEGVSMMRVITAFGREKHEYRRWREQAEKANAARLGLTVRQTIYSLVVGTTTAAGTALLIGFGAANVLEGRLTLGELVVLLGYVAAIYSPLAQVGSTFTSLQQQFINLESSLSILDIPLEVADAPDAIAMSRAQGRVTFDEASFTYGEVSYVLEQRRGGGLVPAATEAPVSEAPVSVLPETVSRRAREVLERPGMTALYEKAGALGLDVEQLLSRKRDPALIDVSFDIQAGQHAAFVGPTGAGKTTLLNLLMRFYDPSRGSISLDGVDLRGLKLASLRAQISVVPQEPLLFAGTIGDNIRYGKLGATDHEVEAAARAANIHDFISALPDEYETVIGERGSQLSGGERQRVSVARAFLKDAPILILDEPTSSVDSQTEAVILTALDRLSEGRTTFTIAHRLSTVRRADVILVLDKGRLVQRGRHEELLAEGGLYRRMHDLQVGLAEVSPDGRAGVEPRQGRFLLLFAALLVAALDSLLRDASTDDLDALLDSLPERVFLNSWPLIGGVLAVLHDGSDAPLQTLARRTGDSRRDQAYAHAARHLLRYRDTLHRIAEELRHAPGRNGAEPLDPDLIVREPWTQMEKVSAEAAKLLTEYIPTDPAKRRQMWRRSRAGGRA